MRRMRGQNLLKEFDNSGTPSPVPFNSFREDYSELGSWTSSSVPDRRAAETGGVQSVRAPCNTLILGMGSEFLGDDGVGVHALRALARESLPGDTELIEISDHLVEALVALQKADRVILLDVLRAKGKPGTVYRVSFQPVQFSKEMPFSHGEDLLRALYMGGSFGFIDVIIIAMEPSVIDLSSKLSTEVCNALPLMIRAVKAELNTPNVAFSRGSNLSFTLSGGLDHFSEDRRRYTS